MQLVPVLFAEVVQQVEAGLKTGEGFTLEQPPGQPGGGPQVLGLGAQQALAALTHFLPVDAAGFMQGGRFAELGFQQFVFAGIAHILAGEVAFINRRPGQIEIMRCQLAGVRHSMTRLLKWATSTASQTAIRPSQKHRSAQLFAQLFVQQIAQDPYESGILAP